MDNTSRRQFITLAGGFALLPQQQPIPKRPDPLVPSMVEEFVRKAHGDLAATKALLADQPALLNATWDWGGGDFETGIGGAGHIGNREIAELLIGQGARFDISLLRHARAGKDAATPVEEYLLSLGAA